MSEIPTFNEALKAAVRGTLRSWKKLPWLSRNLWDSGKEFAEDAILFFVALAGPLFLPLTPVLAWIYRRELRKVIARRKAIHESTVRAYKSNAQYDHREGSEE